jgi:hypothetical protein
MREKESGLVSGQELLEVLEFLRLFYVAENSVILLEFLSFALLSFGRKMDPLAFAVATHNFPTLQHLQLHLCREVDLLLFG